MPRQTRRSSRPTPRKLVWARSAQMPTTTVSAASTALLPILQGFQTAYGADPIGCTIRRIRGTITLRTAAAGGSIQCTLGIGVMNGLPTIANQSPGPTSHLDWMYWQSLYSEALNSTDFGLIGPWLFDVRAQRKMQELGQDLYLAIQNHHASAALVYSYATSTLLALP